MPFRFDHNNINVLDLEKSLAFYAEALGLRETSRIVPEDNSFIIVYLGDGLSSHRLELTWLCDRREPYNLGDNEFHLAFTVDNFAEALAKHRQMNCVCLENDALGIYFIHDPDNYWLEIVPAQKLIGSVV